MYGILQEAVENLSRLISIKSFTVLVTMTERSRAAASPVGSNMSHCVGYVGHASAWIVSTRWRRRR